MHRSNRFGLRALIPSLSALLVSLVVAGIFVGVGAGGCTGSNNTPPPETCGNGTADDGEECDATSSGPGSTCVPPATCTAECVCEDTCGDGEREPGESCDGSAAQSGCDDSTETCSDICDECVPNPSPPCGNGVLDEGEECDPQDPSASCDEGFHCAAGCLCEPDGPICGDGIIESGEECDPEAAATGCQGMATCDDVTCQCEPAVAVSVAVEFEPFCFLVTNGSTDIELNVLFVPATQQPASFFDGALATLSSTNTAPGEPGESTFPVGAGGVTPVNFTYNRFGTKTIQVLSLTVPSAQVVLTGNLTTAITIEGEQQPRCP